jgi:hypothetical protein
MMPLRTHSSDSAELDWRQENLNRQMQVLLVHDQPDHRFGNAPGEQQAARRHYGGDQQYRTLSIHKLRRDQQCRRFGRVIDAACKADQTAGENVQPVASRAFGDDQMGRRNADRGGVCRQALSWSQHASAILFLRAQTQQPIRDHAQECRNDGTQQQWQQEGVP